MKSASRTAVAYARTSSAQNVAGDSRPRQRAAIQTYAERNNIEIVKEFYDPAVSGAVPLHDRPGFQKLLAYLRRNGARLVLVENASRFARDLMVQEVGFAMLKREGFDLVAVDHPDGFQSDGPTAVMVRQILGAVSGFQKESGVLTLRAARERKRAETGKCEGRKPAMSADALTEARAMRADGAIYTDIAQRLFEMDPKENCTASGEPWSKSTIHRNLARTDQMEGAS